MGRVDVVQTDEGWWFRFDDGLITELRVGYRFVLVMNDALIGFERPFELDLDGRTSVVPPGDSVHDVSAALPLFNRRVRDARASRTGALQVNFVDGTVIRVDPDPSGLYEAWQVELSGDRVWVGIGEQVGQPRTIRGRSTESG